MKQYTGNQYDDDLTVGTEDYDDSYYTGSVDLFEFATDQESPISRLKSLILSIDWEITDEILMQFNEELLDLRDIWAGEKINLVYVQALEKISKYIYQKKADSHPSAIKLLLTLYHNLEKIVSSFDLSEEQKKEILFEDVKRFESLKRHIGQGYRAIEPEPPPVPAKPPKTAQGINEQDLLNLKALVLGIDWEITDRDLIALRTEVVRLEEKFASSRPKLILLQGIGTLAAYIRLKKGNAHADAFKLLHLFYESLEKMCARSRSLEDEKAILFPAVERFNTFKALLGPTITADSISRDESVVEEEDESFGDGITLAPAFADIPEEEVRGFQAEEEAQALGFENSGNIDNHVDSFFMGVSLANKQDRPLPPAGVDVVAEEIRHAALQGVNVEVDDEEETDTVPFGGGSPAPALSDVAEDEAEEASSPVAFAPPAEDEESFTLADSPDGPVAEQSTALGSDQQSGLDFSQLDRDLVLQGVDVETEADDDSDEEALPLMGGQLAPALAENDEVSIYNTAAGENVEEEIAGTLGGFFDEEIAAHFTPVTAVEELIVDPVAAVEPDVEHVTAGLEEDLPLADQEPAALSVLVAQKESAPADASDVEEEVIFALVEDEPKKAAESGDMYHSLQACIDGLALELNEKVLAGLWREINGLEQNLAAQPLEKTFLQLLTTVTRHIDRHRTDASAYGYDLCRSITAALVGSQENTLAQNLAVLLVETRKVLEWQEQMLQAHDELADQGHHG